MKKTIIRECLRFAISKIKDGEHPYVVNNKFHFSFIIQNNKVVEYGMNRLGKIAKMYGYDDKTEIHAEFDAYRKARGILDKNRPWEVLNVRSNRAGQIRNSAPCVCCLCYLRELGCSGIWFTTDLGVAKLAALSEDLAHQKKQYND